MPEITVEIVGQCDLACRTLNRSRGGALGRWSLSEVVGVRIPSVGLERREAAGDLTVKRLAPRKCDIIFI